MNEEDPTNIECDNSVTYYRVSKIEKVRQQYSHHTNRLQLYQPSICLGGDSLNVRLFEDDRLEALQHTCSLYT